MTKAYQCISVIEAENIIQQLDPLILDIRDERSFGNGHYAGALNLNNKLLRTLLKTAEKTRPLIIYCYHGHSSQDMAQLFADFGFTQVYSLDGGYEAWFQGLNPPKVPLSEGLLSWMLDHSFMPENLDARGENNETALMRLARDGQIDWLQEIIEAGASINLCNKDGNNALWFACYNKREDVFDCLLAAGIDMNNQNDNGATALIYSSSAGRTDMVARLIEAGCDLSLATLDDFTAKDVASERPILRMLIDAEKRYATEKLDRAVA